MPKETERKSPESEEYDGPSWLDHSLARVQPKDERRQQQQSRRWHKQKYGTSDEVLDKLYGINSR